MAAFKIATERHEQDKAKWEAGLHKRLEQNRWGCGSILGFAFVAGLFGTGLGDGGFAVGFCAGLFGGLLLAWLRSEMLAREYENSFPKPAFRQAAPALKLVQDGDLALEQQVFRDVVERRDFRRQVLQRDGFRCQCCGHSKPAEELHVHHVMPRAKSGMDHPTNLVTECISCHESERWFGHRFGYPGSSERQIWLSDLLGGTGPSRRTGLKRR